MTQPAPPRLPRWVPIALVAAACLTLALTGRTLDSVWPKTALGPLRDYRPPVMLAAVVLLTVLIAQLRHYREGRAGHDYEDGRPTLLGRAVFSVLVLIGVAAVATPIGVISMRGPAQPPTPTPTATEPTPTPAPESGTVTPSPTRTGRPGRSFRDFTVAVEITLSVILVLIAVAIIVALVLFLLKLWRAQSSGSADETAGRLPFGTLEDAEDLADAVEAAAAALEGGEAREAVIACYAAMERSMQDAGVRRESSDSPEELLVNASRAGLVRGTAGRRLTDLFREARFSAHLIDETKRSAAREALLEIAADLRDVMAEKAEQAAGAALVAAGKNEAARQAGRTGKRGAHQ